VAPSVADRVSEQGLGVLELAPPQRTAGGGRTRRR
jgi:hypothetical protein